MADASAISRRQMAGGDAGGLLHPAPPLRVRNHARDNMKAIREKERQLRGKKLMEQQAPPVELFKLRQFAGAKPRIFERKAQLKRQPCEEESSPQDQKNACEPEEAGEINLEDFEAQVEELKRKHGGKKQATVTFEKDANGCPAYIRRMKEEAAERARADAEIDKSAPPGFRMLPPNEVADTLAALKKKREEIEGEFRRLPLKIETVSQQRREKAIKAKIEESDRALKMFSQPTVYVEI